MVGDEVLEAVEPERGDAREDLALVGDLVGQDEVIGADAVGRHHEQAVTAVVDVADLAVRVRAKFHLSHSGHLS